MALGRTSAQAGALWWAKAAAASVKAEMCWEGAQGCPSPTALLQGSQDSAALGGPSCKPPEWGLLCSYLEFCLKLVAIWPLSKMMNILGAGGERLRGSGKQRGEGRGNSRLKVPPS